MHTEHSRQNNLIVLVIGLAFLLVGSGCLLGAWGAYFTDIKIQNSGSSAEGHLEKKLFIGSADGDSDYILEYWFSFSQGQKIKASRNVSKELWSSVHEGQTIKIKYSDSNPRRNFPDGEGVISIGVNIFVSIVATALAIFGGALIWGCYLSLSITT
jgi:hypothetical protein